MIKRIEEHLATKYKNQYKSWSKVSYDDSNKVAMIESDDKCLDYDCGIVKEHNSSYFPKCVDGIMIKANKLYFIEFKNGKIDKDTVLDLRLKACESLIEFLNVLKKDGIEIEYSDLISLEPNFILVFNYEKNHHEITDNLNQVYLKETIQFENAKIFLEKYRNVLYKKINITTSEIFKNAL